MSPPKNELQKQLEQQKFLHGISYVNQAAVGIKKLNSSELAQLNQILTDHHHDPWRLNEVQIRIPSGHVHHFNVITNPINRAREIIGHAWDMAENDKTDEGAIYLYSQLVLDHLFTEANRRTAVLATLWLLQAHNMNINAQDLLSSPIGNLRERKNVEALGVAVKKLISAN